MCKMTLSWALMLLTGHNAYGVPDRPAVAEEVYGGVR